MSIKAEILADSYSAMDDSRIITFKIQCPAYCWVDILTHRLLSKSCSSSRAIPSKVWRQMLRENPAIPVMLTSYQEGMASNKPLCAAADANARAIYAEVIDYLIKASEKLEALQVSKQDANAISYGLQHVNALS